MRGRKNNKIDSSLNLQGVSHPLELDVDEYDQEEGREF